MHVRQDLQSCRYEYQHLQCETCGEDRIKNPYIRSGRIANPTERLQIRPNDCKSDRTIANPTERLQIRPNACKSDQTSANIYAQHKKRLPAREAPDLVYEANARLAEADSLRRTNAGASTALSAGISVNHILFALRNCLYGALRLTSSTCDAVITNYICHSCKCLKG